mmetsp:Transcript_23520/g.73808  ORF Transcript_23520/g.73808 Transcript_23520/m.73808 type:complete len:206 (+) Transcript_23520:171-788(+)
MAPPIHEEKRRVSSGMYSAGCSTATEGMYEGGAMDLHSARRRLSTPSICPTPPQMHMFSYICRRLSRGQLAMAAWMSSAMPAPPSPTTSGRKIDSPAAHRSSSTVMVFPSGRVCVTFSLPPATTLAYSSAVAATFANLSLSSCAPAVDTSSPRRASAARQCSVMSCPANSSRAVAVLTTCPSSTGATSARPCPNSTTQPVSFPNA